MAAICTPARQPFGVLNESKLRSLQSIKNRQNALAPNPTTNLKRRAPSPELSDSENVDPNLFDALAKRKRTSLEDDVSHTKKLCPNTYITPLSTNTKTFKSPCISTASAQASRQTPNTTPSSAPAAVTFAAGRSPTRLTGRPERPISQPRRRFVPPYLNQSSPSISITSALKGTLAHKRSITKQHRKQSRTIEDSKPRSWYFDIFEESEETQDYRMCEWTMTQSSAALDISDDESKSKSVYGQTEQTDRGKENIDPNEALIITAPVTRAAAAAAARPADVENVKDKMTIEESRTPLGDLKTADYYGEGLDATSVVLVHDEEPTTEEDAQEESPTSAQSIESIQLPVEEGFTLLSPASAEECSEEQITVEEIPEWAQRSTLSLDIENDASTEVVQDDADLLMPSHELDAEPADIEIWESESAKDENENAQEDNQPNSVIVWEGETVSASAFCLQEL